MPDKVPPRGGSVGGQEGQIDGSNRSLLYRQGSLWRKDLFIILHTSKYLLLFYTQVNKYLLFYTQVNKYLLFYTQVNKYLLFYDVNKYLLLFYTNNFTCVYFTHK